MWYVAMVALALAIATPGFAGLGKLAPAHTPLGTLCPEADTTTAEMA
tara:strand:+ start:2797 stop:2937 length:141 start_codon:yes stop_codon:yes gene_type:complete